MKRHLLTLALTAAGLPALAQAAPFSPFDVRAAGMGGTGVASAKSASAALFNPAMLSAQVEGDKFQFVLGAGAAVADTENLFEQIDELEVTLDELKLGNGNLTSVRIDIPSADLQKAAATGLKLINQFSSINNDSLVAGAGAGLSIGVPGPRVGVGVFISAQAHAVATPVIAGSDISSLTDYYSVIFDGTINSAELTAMKAALNTPTSLFTVAGDATNSSNLVITVNDPQSQADGIAVMVAEYGVALSHRIDLANGGWLSVGAAPKALEASTFDYTANIKTWDDADFDASNNETTDSGFDLDAGVVYRMNANSPWQVAIAAKNLLGNDFKTRGGRTVELATQVRAGVARMTERTTIAIDLDLVQNDGVLPRGDTQFLAFGAEYDLKYLQLRCGYRANLASSDIEDALSAGLGLGPLDLSVIGNENDIGASLQLGFGW